MVSHDLKLLDRSITKVLHLSDSRLHEFKGTYSSYLTQLEADLSQRERAAQLEGREIKRLSTLADSMRGSTNRRARIAKSIDKRVERLESSKTEVHKRERASNVPPAHPGAVRRGPAPYPRAGRPLRRTARSCPRWSSTARRRDRIVIVGRNGAGKSSLLRCLAGVQEPSSGSVDAGGQRGARATSPRSTSR